MGMLPCLWLVLGAVGAFLSGIFQAISPPRRLSFSPKRDALIVMRLLSFRHASGDGCAIKTSLVADEERGH